LSAKTLFGWCLKAPIRFDKHYSEEENLNILYVTYSFPCKQVQRWGINSFLVDDNKIAIITGTNLQTHKYDEGI